MIHSERIKQINPFRSGKRFEYAYSDSLKLNDFAS